MTLVMFRRPRFHLNKTLKDPPYMIGMNFLAIILHAQKQLMLKQSTSQGHYAAVVTVFNGICKKIHNNCRQHSTIGSEVDICQRRIAHRNIVLIRLNLKEADLVKNKLLYI